MKNSKKPDNGSEEEEIFMQTEEKCKVLLCLKTSRQGIAFEIEIILEVGCIVKYSVVELIREYILKSFAGYYKNILPFNLR